MIMHTPAFLKKHSRLHPALGPQGLHLCLHEGFKIVLSRLAFIWL